MSINNAMEIVTINNQYQCLSPSLLTNSCPFKRNMFWSGWLIFIDKFDSRILYWSLPWSVCLSVCHSLIHSLTGKVPNVLLLWRGPRQEIQLSSLLTTALFVPLSADRSATELSIIRLASELIAILASELLHLSLREQAISVHHVWLEIFPVPSFFYNSTITFTFIGWSSYPTLRIIRLALAPSS